MKKKYRIISRITVYTLCAILSFSKPMTLMAYAEDNEGETTDTYDLIDADLSEEDGDWSIDELLNAGVEQQIDDETEIISSDVEDDNLEMNDDTIAETEQIKQVETISDDNEETVDDISIEINGGNETAIDDGLAEVLDENEDMVEFVTNDVETIEAVNVLIDLKCLNGNINYEDYDNDNTIRVNGDFQLIVNGDESFVKGVDAVTLTFNLKVDSKDELQIVKLTKGNSGYIYNTQDLKIKQKKYEIYNINICIYDKNSKEIPINYITNNLINSNTHITCVYRPEPFVKDGVLYLADKDDLVNNNLHIIPGFGFWRVELSNIGGEGYSDARFVNQKFVGDDALFFVDTDLNKKNRKYLIQLNYYGWGFFYKFDKYIIVDEVKPEVDYEFFYEDSQDPIEDINEQYLAKSVRVRIRVDEYNIKNFAVLDKDKNVLFDETDLIQEKDGEYFLEYIINRDGEYYFETYCEDMVGWTAEDKSVSFIIDTTTPEVSIAFDNNNPKNGYYYNSDRSATISVKEKNFDTEDYTFKVNSKYGNSVTLGSWSQSGDEYTCKAVFKGDDEYSATFSCEDKAGNKSDEIKVDRFVVDKTAPKLDCSYDNTFAHKANYYNAARTAKITVSDMSFTSDLVDIDNSGDQNVTITGWSGDGNSYSSEIVCTADGKYQFYVYAEDLAGNKSERLDCGSFIIDTIAPTIEISGVMDKSANSGAVIPTVNCKDINLDNDNSIVTVSGYINGVVNPSDINLVDGSGKNVTYNIFAFEKVSDDIYTVTAVAEDMAGNKAEISYMFSVNRFGSTFGVTQQTADLVGKYYTNAEQDLVLLETNVDNVDEQELYITKNGKNVRLVKGVDYFVEKEGTDATWKAYTYTVKKSNFVEEGTYEVSLFTKDKAGNQSDSNAQGMTIKFAVDKSAPSIVVAGIEDSKLYESSSLDINIDVQDNMEINYAEILIDGKVVKKYAANELEDIVTYSIEESEDSMTVIVRAVDIVGNLSEKKYENVVVSTIVKAEETVEVEDEIVPLSDVDSTQEIVKSSEIDNVIMPDNSSIEEVVEKTDVFFYGVLITVAVLACVGGTAIVLRRKRK